MRLAARREQRSYYAIATLENSWNTESDGPVL